MSSHESMSQWSPRAWPPDYPYCLSPLRSTPQPSPPADGARQLGGPYKTRQLVTANGAGSCVQGMPQESLMSSADAIAQWGSFPEFADYRQEPPPHHQIRSSQHLPLFAEPVNHHAYGPASADRDLYVFLPKDDFAGMDSVSSIPRSFANPLACLATNEPILSAYQLGSHMMDTQGNEMRPVSGRKRASDAANFTESGQQNLGWLTLAPRSALKESLALPSPTASLSSDGSNHVSCQPAIDLAPAQEAHQGPADKSRDDETDADENEPYAKLIYRALLSVPGHRMRLREIYDWFIANTDKSKNPTQKGWQNSIRHNLSMNGAFKKVEQDSTDDGKKGYIWVLEESAITEGVKSTTRYRKTGGGKRAAKSDNVPSAAAPHGPHEQEAAVGATNARKAGQVAKRGKFAPFRRQDRAAAAAARAAASRASTPAGALAPGVPLRASRGGGHCTRVRLERDASVPPALSAAAGATTAAAMADRSTLLPIKVEPSLSGSELPLAAAAAAVQQPPSYHTYPSPTSSPPSTIMGPTSVFAEIVGVADEFADAPLFYDDTDNSIDLNQQPQPQPPSSSSITPAAAAAAASFSFDNVSSSPAGL